MGQSSQTVKRQGKEGCSYQPENHTRKSLDRGGEQFRSPPPPDEPAQQCNRVIRGMRIPEKAVHQQRGKKNEYRERYL